MLLAGQLYEVNINIMFHIEPVRHQLTIIISIFKVFYLSLSDIKYSHANHSSLWSILYIAHCT